ncbi:FAD-dependent oxidoreductase [Amycolatopsis mediterranei S699]|uniref:FAD-dependent oxidoreductase n=2 Tax=Amycolatopsis mediterranei TaxID=33910 RepID=A0A0H3DGP9_AMYMU|nr:FAD-dependent monooxygenase [Amycolatopsis mediterranei]ADJ48819.1 FAD-dependent oxidoreductase [Amycolatopsis mediterranei U32]AEK45761.1 FAD-dependent oxidoreductase [Amycolatopsis mediterranei S699]AFO80528.1 FAD-dependent oxidoreductase [Amycolatopsis mediterranei S699]AGT87656.1 FAD-dependent oxidoreductase [Amycolatopsis mediterranei RB]KDU94071.1 FAD-dependent oxidoreductase [Amycolatopsis mediterranei]
MTKALIIGGGIAGPVAAMALQKAGIDSVVYEAYPEGADDVGAFMTIMNNGFDALHAIDADKPVLEASFPADRALFWSGSGKLLGEAPIGGGSTGAYGPHTIKRAELYRVLHDEAVRRGIKIEHDKRLDDVDTDLDQSVAAVFADGTRREGDLLIGADGIHSATRVLIEPDAPEPRYTGTVVLCGYARRAPVDPVPGVYRMIYGKRVFFAYTTAPTGETWWFVNLPGPEMRKAELAETSLEGWKRQATVLLRGDRSPASAIVEASEEIRASNGYDIASTPTWHTGRMIVIGDAAHAAAPNAGHGASMAMEDAIVLAKCLRDVPDVADAFRIYEGQRRERVERLVATSARMGGTATPGPVKRILRDMAIRKRLKGGPRNTAVWLTQHHIDWEANYGCVRRHRS